MKKYFIYLLCSFQFVQGMYTPTIKTTLTAINALVFMADCNIDCKIHDEIARHPTWENQLNQHAKASGRMSAWIVPSQITMSSVCISHDQLIIAAAMTLGAFSTYIQRDEKLQATLNVLRHHEQE